VIGSGVIKRKSLKDLAPTTAFNLTTLFIQLIEDRDRKSDQDSNDLHNLIPVFWIFCGFHDSPTLETG
jgi:hypothetical protein